MRLKVIMGHLPLGLTCREVEDFIDCYLDNELAALQRLAFRLHIKACVECREYLDAYQMARKLAKAEAEKVVSEMGEIPEDLVTAILKARGNSKN